MTAESESDIKETQAGAATRGATTGASTETAGTLAQVETVMDTGQGEAWIANMKAMFDEMLKVFTTQSNQILTGREVGVSAANNLIEMSAAAAGNVIQAGAQETIDKMRCSSTECQKATGTMLHEVDKLTSFRDELEQMVVAKLAELLGIKPAESEEQ